MALINNDEQSSLGPKTNLIVNYLPQDLTDRSLYLMFCPFGSIESARIVRDKSTGYSYGYGFVNYRNESSAYKAIINLNGLEVDNKKLKVSFARPAGDDLKDSNLYISNLPKMFTEEELEDLFKTYGRIVQQSLLKDKFTGDPKGVAFVRFNKREEAENAMKSLNGKLLKGSREPLSIKVANAGKHKAVCHRNSHSDTFATGYAPYALSSDYAGPGDRRRTSHIKRDDGVFPMGPPFLDDNHLDPLPARLAAELCLHRRAYFNALPHDYKDEYGPLHVPMIRRHDYLRPSYRYHPIRRPMYSRTW